MRLINRTELRTVHSSVTVCKYVKGDDAREEMSVANCAHALTTINK